MPFVYAGRYLRFNVSTGQYTIETIHDAGVLPDMALRLKDYYALRKWDENGIPTQEAMLP
jgi:hypothetical protein